MVFHQDPQSLEARFDGIRSLLLVPGDDAEALLAALASNAHAVVADLEDSVAESRKQLARKILRGAIETRAGGAVLIRANSVDSVHWRDDLTLCAELPLDGVVVPKASTDALAGLGNLDLPVIATIETARGLKDVDQVAAHPAVGALVIGANDLSRELGVEPLPGRSELLYARSRVVAASATRGLRRPFDIVYRAVPAGDDLESETTFGRGLGFGGKATTRIVEVACINAVYATDDLLHGGRA